MYGYIYKTTNLINGKIYIGQHISETFDLKYKGSGIRLQAAFKKYGKKNFDCILIEACQSLEELNQKEMFWIAEFNACDPEIGYNIKLGGNNAPWPEEVKQRIGQGNAGKKRSPEYIEAMRKRQMGNKNNGGRNKGRIVLHKDSTNVYVLPEEVDSYLSQGWIKGVKPKTEQQKVSYKNQYANRVYINKDGKNKYIPKNQMDLFLNSGWALGRVGYTAERAAHIQASKKGTIAVVKEGIRRYIKPEDLDLYRSQGFEPLCSNKRNTQ